MLARENVQLSGKTHFPNRSVGWPQPARANFTKWCLEESSAVTTAVMEAAAFVALAMALERPYDDLDDELGSSAEFLRPWNISREEFWIGKKAKPQLVSGRDLDPG